MKKININNSLMVMVMAVSLGGGLMGSVAVLAAGPATVNLGTAGHFVILSKTGISTTGTTSIVGDVGVSPAAATYITGFALMLPAASAFSTSALVTGKVYAPSYADPTPAILTTAVLDMQIAYTDAAGRAPTVTELGAGNIGGLTLAPGVYKWGTGVTIPTDVTLSGSANDVWIFQIAQNLNMSSAAKIILAGGAQASNIFWVVAGQTTIGTTAIFNGTILDQTAIVLNTGAMLNGRALAQTAVTLDANAVTMPVAVTATPAPTSTFMTTSTAGYALTTTSTASSSGSNNVMCTQDVMQCPNGSYVARQGPTCAFAACPVSMQQTSTTIISSDPNVALQAQLDGLMATYQSLQAQLMQQGSSASSPFGQYVRSVTINLKKGSRGEGVTMLQQFLISQNKGSAAQALAQAGTTTYFGTLTRAALAEFQENVGINPASGNFGAMTRAYVGAHY